jgi:magnesium chelatase family protein
MPGAAMVGGPDPESSAIVAERIAAARRRQQARPAGRLNAHVSGRVLRRIANLDREAGARLADLSDVELLSGRGTERLLRVALTVADLAGAASVEVGHLEEAARWRPPSLRAPAALAV